MNGRAVVAEDRRRAADFIAMALAAEVDCSDKSPLCLLEMAAYVAPSWDEPWIRLAQYMRGQNKIVEAREYYRRATSLPICRNEPFIAAGVLALRNNDPLEAFSYLEEATRRAPDNDEAWHAFSIACLALGVVGLSLEAVTRAGVLAPHCFRYAMMHSDVLAVVSGSSDISVEVPQWTPAVQLALEARKSRRLGYLQEAIAFSEAALKLQPGDPDLLQLHADFELSCQEPERAELFLRDALKHRPGDIDITNDLAVSLGRQYRYGEAADLLDSLIIPPESASTVLLNRATIRASSGNISGSIDDIETAAPYAEKGLLYQTESTLLPYKYGTTAGDLFAAMRRLASTLPEECPPLAKITDFRPDKVLRVGVLSHTLRQHPVGWLTFAGLENLDWSMFELHCFGHYTDHDRFAKRLSGFCASWHECTGMGVREIAELIAENMIDILIDLSGIGDGGLLGALAYRPSPVQIKWVGTQASTTGMKRVDWILTDRWETPVGYEQFYTERLLRLPDGYVCYSPPPDPPSVTALPARANGYVTFGCFNNLSKITDESLSLWGRVLSHLPNSRLILRCPQFSEVGVPDRFLKRAAEIGINLDRLELRGRAGHHQFISGYQDVDVALDPIPYSGGLTTCEALFMGVPVITLAGDFFAARHSVSHLSNVGLCDCVTDSTDSYVDKAVAMASDLEALASLRAGLRQRVLESPLCDAPRFGRNLGNALRSAWKECCQLGACT